MLPSLTVLLSLVWIGSSAPHAPVKRAQTVFMAGDSTMQNYKSGNIQGWGYYLSYSLSLPVSNQALGGRSARSFTVEGRFDTIIKAVQPNDIVIIEFGHNDGGSLSTDNGRTDCPGAGSETCTSTYNGQTVTVLTFPAYLINAGKAITAKGGKVILSSQTPNNPWESGTWTYSSSRFTTYAKAAADSIGAGAQFIDHGTYTANIFKTLGKTAVDGMFPNDHTHTGPEGADHVAKAFVKAVLCSSGGILNAYVKNATATVEGACV